MYAKIGNGTSQITIPNLTRTPVLDRRLKRILERPYNEYGWLDFTEDLPILPLQTIEFYVKGCELNTDVGSNHWDAFFEIDDAARTATYLIIGDDQSTRELYIPVAGTMYNGIRELKKAKKSPLDKEAQYRLVSATFVPNGAAYENIRAIVDNNNHAMVDNNAKAMVI